MTITNLLGMRQSVTTSIAMAVLLLTSAFVFATPIQPVQQVNAEEIQQNTTNEEVSVEETTLKSLRAVNFMDPILSSRESGERWEAPAEYVTQSLNMLRSHGFNAIRVPYFWESYVVNPDVFLNEVEFIASTAEETEIYVIFDFHQWRTTSNWDLSPRGKGFPSFVLQDYPANAYYSSTARPFWKGFWNNAITINGANIWDLQIELMAKIIERVDDYDSVLGYEILNEPVLFHVSQYEKLGNYHTYIAQKLRQVTDKMIFFDREITIGFVRQPRLESLIVPWGVDNIVYAPHLYNVPYLGSQAEEQIDRFNRWSKQWDIPVFIGEFAAKTEEDMKVFVDTFEQSGFGWAYWRWGGDNAINARQLIKADDNDIVPTIYLEYLSKAIYPE